MIQIGTCLLNVSKRKDSDERMVSGPDFLDWDKGSDRNSGAMRKLGL